MYLHEIEGLSPEQIAYVDESGIDHYLYRPYGWAPRGELVYDAISGKRYKRTSIVAAQIGKIIVAPMQYDATMNSTLFEAWFEQMLLPSLPPETVIVMDNASFHRKGVLTVLAEDKGYRLVFLPPYSPELSPIENFWAWLKRKLQAILPSSDSFDRALVDCFQGC